MIIYHGSNVIVDKPRMVFQNRTLDFVFANRNDSYQGEHYDIVFRPVANDTIYRTFIAYEEGILTKEETIARLKVKKLYNQMTFTSERALLELKYAGQLSMGRDCDGRSKY